MFRAPLVVRNLAKAVPRRAGHGHAAPSTENTLPKWVQALEQAPRAQAIAGAVGAVIVTSGLIASIVMARGEKKHIIYYKTNHKIKQNIVCSSFFPFGIFFFPFRYSTTH